MHTNFITPPDFVETVLIINATEAQIQSCADVMRDTTKPYNVYFYNDSMEHLEWLARVNKIADKIIQAEITDPVEYFTK